MNHYWTLPSESVPQRSLRTVIRDLAAASLLLLAVNAAAFAAMQVSNVNLGYEIVRQKFVLADTIDEPVDWLFLGDSTCNQGMSPVRFEELTGQTALNLCLTGDMTVLGDAWVLQRLLDRVGQPRRGVLLSHAYDVWKRDGDRIEIIAAEIPGSLHWRRTRALRPMTTEELARATVGQYFPLVSRPNSAHLLLYSLVRPRPALNLDAAGFMDAGAADPRGVEGDVSGHLRRSEEDFSISELNRRSLILVDERSEVPVYIVPSPMNDRLWADEGVQARVAQVYGGVAAVAHEREGLTLLRDTPWVYSAEQMNNADHVDGETALEHTAAVADLLRDSGALGPSGH